MEIINCNCKVFGKEDILSFKPLLIYIHNYVLQYIKDESTKK